MDACFACLCFRRVFHLIERTVGELLPFPFVLVPSTATQPNRQLDVSTIFQQSTVAAVATADAAATRHKQLVLGRDTFLRVDCSLKLSYAASLKDHCHRLSGQRLHKNLQNAVVLCASSSTHASCVRAAHTQLGASAEPEGQQQVSKLARETKAAVTIVMTVEYITYN